MPRPIKGLGQTSSIRSALSVPDEKIRNEYISKIASVYGETHDLTRTAQEFGTGRRTLERLIRDVPELAQAIETVRSTNAVFKGDRK